MTISYITPEELKAIQKAIAVLQDFYVFPYHINHEDKIITLTELNGTQIFDLGKLTQLYLSNN